MAPGASRPTVGASVRHVASGRVGRVIIDDGSELPFKVQFADGVVPAADWFREGTLENAPDVPAPAAPAAAAPAAVAPSVPATAPCPAPSRGPFPCVCQLRPVIHPKPKPLPCVCQLTPVYNPSKRLGPFPCVSQLRPVYNPKPKPLPCVSQLRPVYNPKPPAKVLIVATSADSLKSHKTGAWSEEICGPYYIFKDGGCDVTVCSVSGGDIPIDAGSLGENFKTKNDDRMIQEGSGPLKSTKPLTEFDMKTIDIVFFAGGHGTCVDFCTDAMGEKVAEAVVAGKVVAAVCHGPMALINAKVDGTPVVRGKKVACFTDEEEGMVGLTETVPFLLESKMKELGATISTGAAWSDSAVADGKLVTGQNPQSSVSCAKLAIAALK